VSGSASINHSSELKSYQFFGKAVLEALRTNMQWGTWPAREEYRMTLKLLGAVEDEWETRGSPTLRNLNTPQTVPFYVHPTQVVNEFIKSLVMSYGVVYESVLLQRELGDLTRGGAKLICMWGSLLKTCLGSSLLEREDFLRSEALMMKESIGQWGFAWIPTYLIDWKRHEFRSGISGAFLPIDVIVAKHFPRNKPQHQQNQSYLAELAEVASACAQTRNNTDRLIYIHWLGVKVIRQYTKEVWEATYQSSHTFPKKDQLRRKLIQEHGEEVYKKRYGIAKNRKVHRMGGS
jgi:hypothetical protein